MSFFYKAVLFDWAYTLIDLVEEDDKSAFLGLFEFLSEKGCDLPEFEEFFQTYRELFYGLIKVSRETHQEACFDVVLKSLLFQYRVIIPDDITLSDLLTIYYKKIYSCRKIYPDTISTLEKLKSQKVRMGIISNTTNPGFMKDYERKASGLDQYFEFSLYSSEMPYRKPHPSMFEQAVRYLEFAPEDILFVGDTLKADIYGAKQVGMSTAWINRSGNGNGQNGDIQPTYEIRSLAEILSLDVPVSSG